jgi:hypothetical protein
LKPQGTTGQFFNQTCAAQRRKGNVQRGEPGFVGDDRQSAQEGQLRQGHCRLRGELVQNLNQQPGRLVRDAFQLPPQRRLCERLRHQGAEISSELLVGIDI